MNSLRPSLPVLTVVLLLSFTGVLVRGIVSQSELLWLDELHTSWTVNDSVINVYGRAADGNQQPVYFWLTWFSVFLFGHSEFSLRMISILAGFGTIFCAACFTWKWTDSAIAVFVVGFLIAVDDQFVFYGSEARPYALVQCLGVIQVILFCEAIWGNRTGSTPMPNASIRKLEHRPFWWLALASVMLVYIHLTSIWLMSAEAIFLLIMFATNRKMKSSGLRSGRFIWTALIAFPALIPAVIQTASIMQRKGNWQSISSASELFKDSFPMIISLIVIPIVYLTASRSISRMFAGYHSIKDDATEPLSDNQWVLVFAFAWAVVPLIVVSLLEILAIAPMALPRYTLVGAAGFPVFAGLCIGRLSLTSNRLGLAIVVVIASWVQNPILQTVAEQHRLPRFRVEDWEDPIAQLNSVENRSSQPIFLFANVIEDNDALTKADSRFQAYLLFPVGGMYEIRNRNREIAAGPTLKLTHFSDDQIQLINEHGGAWILIRAQFEIVVEIGDELRNRLGELLQKDAGQIEISQFHATDSPVYLLSVEL